MAGRRFLRCGRTCREAESRLCWKKLPSVIERFVEDARAGPMPAELTRTLGIPHVEAGLRSRRGCQETRHDRRATLQSFDGADQ